MRGRIREDWGLGGKDFKGLSEKGYGGLRDEWGGLQMIYRYEWERLGRIEG